MNGPDIIQDGVTVHLVASEGKIHVIYGWFEDFPTRGIVDGGDLVGLNDGLGRQSLAGAPGGDHIDLFLDGELTYRRHCFGNLVGRVHQKHFDAISRDTPLDLVDVTKIILLSPGVKLAPTRGGTRHVDCRPHLYDLRRRPSGDAQHHQSHYHADNDSFCDPCCHVFLLTRFSPCDLKKRPG